MEKSADAFRTISEVAEHLDTPAHVLRFWESRFPQIKPVKRAGGRRYYRPSDVALLVGIRRLLHDEGMTIRGVQKILREQGVRHVSGLAEGALPEGETLDADVVSMDVAPEPEMESSDQAAPAEAPSTEADLDALIAMTVTGQTAEMPAPATGSAPAEAAPGLSGLFGTTAASQPVDTAAEAMSAPSAQAATPEAPQQMPLFAVDPMPAATAAAPVQEVETPPIANRLRHLRRKQLAARRTELVALAARLTRLRDKLASAPPAARN
jgi:DNA-binding transcriptional MerR regulator